MDPILGPFLDHPRRPPIRRMPIIRPSDPEWVEFLGPGMGPFPDPFWDLFWGPK